MSGHQQLAVRGQFPKKTDPDAGRLLGVVFEAVTYDRGSSNPTWNTRSPANINRSPPDAKRTTLCPGVWPPVRWTTTPGATWSSFSNVRSWP